MAMQTKESAQLLELDDDPRRLLVERIVSSASFAKSERLPSFLRCVCQLAQEGREEEINEQYVGSAVFGRDPDYDPGVDSIVRSHASRLRHRLQQYFAEEGAGEELLLTIPKGGYIPVFEPRPGPQGIADELTTGAGRVTSSESGHLISRIEPESPAVFRLAEMPVSPVESEATKAKPQRRLVILLSVALAVVSIAAVGLLTTLLLQRRHATNVNASIPLFWNNLFNGNEKTLVISADSGLVILQGLTKKRVSLDTYLSGEYLNDLPPGAYPLSQTLNLAKRRYTSIVDLTIEEKLFRMPGLDLGRAQFRYARDIRMGELKQGNVVILGTYESTPWVQLFEPSMNFYFQNDLSKGVFSIINRDPHPGEQPTYDSVNNDPQHTVYGIVAYRPTLSGSGKVLILEGQSMAGTETASDFVLDNSYLLPFLRSIRRPDGSIPYFELLLRSKSLSAEASRLETVAFRVEDH